MAGEGLEKEGRRGEKNRPVGFGGCMRVLRIEGAKNMLRSQPVSLSLYHPPEFEGSSAFPPNSPLMENALLSHSSFQCLLFKGSLLETDPLKTASTVPHSFMFLLFVPLDMSYSFPILVKAER